MAEESLRIANDAVAHALHAVVKEQSEIDKWNAKWTIERFRKTCSSSSSLKNCNKL